MTERAPAMAQSQSPRTRNQIPLASGILHDIAFCSELLKSYISSRQESFQGKSSLSKQLNVTRQTLNNTMAS